MPRPRRIGAPEPKRRSRAGCWPCKARKVKCGEEKPTCFNCERYGEKCDYSVRLNWAGRPTKKDHNADAAPAAEGSVHGGEDTAPVLPWKRIKLDTGSAGWNPVPSKGNNSCGIGTVADEDSRPRPNAEGEGAGISVKSLLSPMPAQPGTPPKDSKFYHHGYDCGQNDLDLSGNDDAAAIQHQWPKSPAHPDPLTAEPSQTVFAKGGYYANPVPITIPSHLLPLPPTLLDNPINLLYFHHFINHTARILVPHVCDRNPFEHVLPAMALKDDNLLNMLLAYSASHRARLLGHPEPYNRIALWTRYVFTNLRQSLTPNGSQAQVSDTSLAAAIMLVSLKIVSPTTFETPISWQRHLKQARELFSARTDAQSSCITAEDGVGSFLSRWLGYLDILGSLSSLVDTEPPLVGVNYSAGAESPLEDEYEIDCFAGFTPQCRVLLARLAELIHAPDTTKAEELLHDLTAIGSPPARARRTHHASNHHADDGGDDDDDANGLFALDEAYRLAAIVHLYRRVLSRHASTEPEVRSTVDALADTLDRVPRGGSAEVCCLFPLFTAGCETDDARRREDILRRVQGFEGVGLKQIHAARTLMQRSWKDNRPWTGLASGEFLG